MTKVSIVGNAAVIKAVLKRSELERVAKFNKKRLSLLDEDNNEIFKIVLGDDDEGYLGGNGASFNTVSEDGSALITVLLPAGVADKKKYFAEKHFEDLQRLNVLLKAIHADLEKINVEISSLFDSIEVE